MRSKTYGEVSMESVARIIMNTVDKCYDQYTIIVGTDSMNYDTTKTATVIAVHHVGHGGFFFYDIDFSDRITNLTKKLLYETSKSIEYANELISELDKLYDEYGFEYDRVKFVIHVDAGYSGKTQKVIPDIMAWINSCGYECEVKPNSSVASSVADRLSK